MMATYCREEERVQDRGGKVKHKDEHLNSGSRTESRQFEECFRGRG